MKLDLIRKDWKANRAVYFMLIPVLAYFLVFSYAPMAGVIVAFERFTPKGGIFGSEWVGLKNFADFFKSYYFGRLLTNTFLLSFYDLLFSFPSPIVFALLMNELRSRWFKKTVQTISYMPYFISMVVIAGIVIDFFSSTGALTHLIHSLGGPSGNLLGKSELFRTIFVGTNIWQYLGFSSVIYMAALAGIDQELYEAARLDGANRFQQTLHVTIPGIAATIIVLLILRMGNLMSVNFEKVILLYSPAVYSTGDVITSFTYRKGITEFNYGYSTAVGLFNSAMNFIILVLANWISRRFSKTSLF